MKNFKLIELFTIEFTDGTKLWANSQNGEVCFGYLGKGYNLLVKEIFEKVPYNKLCYFAQIYSEQSKFIKSFIDHVEEKSNELQKQLLKAF